MSNGSQVLRATSGDVIQVRTGVIQGIGPQGPVGPTGPQGIQGEQGAQGVPGPTGQVIEHSSEFNALSQSLASSTGTSLVAFSQVVRDDFSAAQSTTNFALPVGSFQGIVYLTFAKQAGNAVNTRSVEVLFNSGIIAGVTTGAAPTRPHEITVPFALKTTTAGLILQVQAGQDEGATLAISGRLFISRIGPGPKGDAGPQGTQGPVGAIGATGPQGPSGTIGSNTTTFAAIGG